MRVVWVFEKGGKAALVFSTLEALAVLIAFKLLHGGHAPAHRYHVLVTPTWADTKG